MEKLYERINISIKDCYFFNSVSAHPSTAMSWVAANVFKQKNTNVSVFMSDVNQLFKFDPTSINDNPAYSKIDIIKESYTIRYDKT